MTDIIETGFQFAAETCPRRRMKDEKALCVVPSYVSGPCQKGTCPRQILVGDCGHLKRDCKCPEFRLTIGGIAYKHSYAAFSDTLRHRYALGRSFVDGGSGRILFVMLNPSTADLYRNDPSVQRCASWAKEWGFEGFDICNAFALRSTDPRALYMDNDPIGHQNNEYIAVAAQGAKEIVIAWGVHAGKVTGPTGKPRHEEVLDIIARATGVKPKCFTLTKNGFPGHPLYLPNDTQLVQYI